MSKLDGKVAIVTGAGRGLGRAYALHLARLGADVVVNDISMEAHKEYDEPIDAPSVPEEIRQLGRRSLGIVADVTKRAEVDRMVAQTVAELGRVDILVNNAGGALVAGPSVASEVPVDDFQRMMDINFWGTVNCCQAVAPGMKAQRYGKIVNVGSQAGLRSQGDGRGTAYSVAKATIHHYTRKLASDLGPHGVYVNAIAPGWILSSRAIAGGRGRPESVERLNQEIALKRLGTPEDCARVVEFLVTDLSDYVTGQVIPVCGGVCLFPS
jgi:NAD(P)-dependent dehydrogenase (short-subunit alcohol dehydrogenase family)